MYDIILCRLDDNCIYYSFLIDPVYFEDEVLSGAGTEASIDFFIYFSGWLASLPPPCRFP